MGVAMVMWYNQAWEVLLLGEVMTVMFYNQAGRFGDLALSCICLTTKLRRFRDWVCLWLHFTIKQFNVC